MAITNAALAVASGGAPGQPQYDDIVTLDLDASYPNPGPTGGYADFYATTLAPIIGKGKTVIAVRQNNSVGTTPVHVGYDRANDKLLCYDWAGAEIANGVDLSGVVGLELVITSR